MTAHGVMMASQGLGKVDLAALGGCQGDGGRHRCLEDKFDFMHVNIMFGSLAWLFFTGAVAFTLLRRSNWEGFYWNHFMFFPASILLLFHTRANWHGWFAIIMPLFQYDYFLRWLGKYFRKFEVADLTIAADHPATPTCKLTIKKTDTTATPFGKWAGFDWEPGSYVWLSFGGKSFEIKLRQPAPPVPKAWNFHPYTISSPPNEETQEFSIHIKSVGKPGEFSDVICKLAADCDADGGSKKKELLAGLNTYISGPYGSLAVEPKFYDTVVMFAGGIGITPLVSICSDMLARPAEYPNVKKIVLNWVTRSENELAMFGDEFVAMAMDERFTIIHYKTTGAQFGADSVETIDDVEKIETPTGVDSVAGRPVPAQILKPYAVAGQKIAVLNCGPKGLVTAVGKAVGELQSSGAVIHVHDETFLF
jgi:ferredoxin-NADP reductase